MRSSKEDDFHKVAVEVCPSLISRRIVAKICLVAALLSTEAEGLTDLTELFQEFL